MEEHNAAISKIADRIKIFHDRKQPFRIYHGSTNSTRRSQYRQHNVVDTSNLTHVLKVDPQNLTALVEPNVPMDALVEEALRFGLVPPVVMEFPGITTGGGFAGTSGESSSFRHGFFDRTILSIEMVLANGEITQASHTNYADLFLGAASSFGTLGVTTLLEIRLLPAKEYVLLTYVPVANVADAVNVFKESASDQSVDYLDGILFSKDSGVVCVGHLSDNPNGYKIQSFSAPSDPWFYTNAESLIKKGSYPNPVVEAIPLVDYLFRYDRGGFWVAKYAFDYFKMPFNNITRRILDRFMHTRVMYHALHKSGHSDRYVIQDVAIPYSAASDFVEYLDHSFGHYPLWLCPLLQTVASPMSPRSLQTTGREQEQDSPGMLLNFGVWGPGPKGRHQFVAANRSLERKVYDLGGKKWLYAHAYYTEDEFWDIYDRERYDALRTKYHATHLPSIYDKVKVDVAAERRAVEKSWMAWVVAIFWSIWPLSGVYGVLHTVLRTDYLMPRRTRPEIELKVE